MVLVGFVFLCFVISFLVAQEAGDGGLGGTGAQVEADHAADDQAG